MPVNAQSSPWQQEVLDMGHFLYCDRMCQFQNKGEVRAGVALVLLALRIAKGVHRNPISPLKLNAQV